MPIGQIYLALIVLQFSVVVYCDLSSSVSEIERFLQHEISTFATLETIIYEETQCLEHLKKHTEIYKKVINNGMSDGVINPVHIYVLLKNIYKNWNEIEQLVEYRPSDDFEQIALQREENFLTAPTDVDVKQALESLVNLQQIYNLSIHAIASGNILNGETENKNKTVLNSLDCYQIGRIYFDTKDYRMAYQWMEYSLSLMENETNGENLVEKMEILNYMYQALNETGRTDEALHVLKQILNIQPNNIEIKEKVNLIIQAKQNEMKAKRMIEKIEKYKLLCNYQEVNTDNAKNLNLSCHYHQQRTPFTKLSPLKVEQVSTEPSIQIFRQIISDHEIELLKRFAISNFERAKVIKGYDNAVANKDRFAKIAWLYPTKENQIFLKTLDVRLYEMTGLDMKYAEMLQICNYGVGGHFTTHVDAIPNRAEKNRLTTVMFYLSTPEAGGATVFPLLNLTLFPTKNDAVVWYNLLQNGDIDPRSEHGGCPVLAGSKWVANKWIGSRGQEFLRPCTLNNEM